MSSDLQKVLASVRHGRKAVAAASREIDSAIRIVRQEEEQHGLAKRLIEGLRALKQKAPR